ncbi:septum formation initiator family protein [Patescibacteria group bacterium]|nr:septum formation initiator family protein [Patescibacteria group bacterium]
MITNYKKRKKSLSILYIVILIVIIVSTFYLLLNNLRVQSKKTGLNKQLASLENEIKELEAKNSNLSSGILNVDDVEYVEKVAREDLNLQKEGETVVGFILPPKKEREEEENIEGLFFKIKKWFAGMVQW